MKTITWVGDVHLVEATPRSRKDNYMETLLSKVAYLLETSDIVVFLGDLFDRYQVSDFCKNALLRVLQGYPNTKKYVIYGNHDIVGYNVETLNRSSLGLFLQMGAVELLTDLEVEGMYVHCPGFHRDPCDLDIRVPEGRFPSVLIGHYFYENTLDPRFSLTEGQLAKSGYTYAILGHDHEPHEMAMAGPTMVLRAGSICRNSSHLFQLKRQPMAVRFAVNQLDPSRPPTVRVEYVTIPAPRPEEVFHDVTKYESASPLAFLTSMDDLMAAFHRLNAKDRLSVHAALKELDAPPVVVEYLRGIHEKCRLDF